MTTVQKTQKVVSEKGAKVVVSVVLQERGKLETLCCAANVLGNTISPFFCISAGENSAKLAINSSPSPLGNVVIGHKSQPGWQNVDTFLTWLKHFVEYAKPSESQPILLILDNCSSHVDVSIIDYAKKHYITLLSFPPHCSHRLQPLDVSVFGPNKTYKDQKVDTWMRENPGRSMSI